MPKVISENKTYLSGGERELREAIKKWNQQKIESFLHQRNRDLTPNEASHMGGVWERIIRSVRRILGNLLKEQLVIGEALRTFMAEVESILNSRVRVISIISIVNFIAFISVHFVKRI